MKKYIYFNYGLGLPADGNPKNFNILPEDFFSGIPEKADNELTPEYEHSVCPAVRDWYRNNFIIKMPFDLSFKFNEEKKILEIIDHPNTYILSKKLLVLHPSFIKNSNINEVQLTFYYIFWLEPNNKDEVWIELNHHPDLQKFNIKLIPGRFPISAWLRPIHFAFKIIDKSKPVSIPKGQPLYHIRFFSKKNDDIFELKKTMPDEKVLKKFNEDTILKLFCPYQSWKFIKSRLLKVDKN